MWHWMLVRREPRDSGFALAYTFLIVVALVVFFAAVLVRAQQTLRATQYDFETVQARALSETGAELAFNLLREKPNWFLDKEQPFKNEDFGSQFSTQTLGGRFEVRILDRDEVDLDPDPFPPNGGTYKLIVCQAFVNNRQASTFLTIKLTNALINHLVANRGLYKQKSWASVNGPVFIDSNPDTGESGDYQFCPNVLGIVRGTPVRAILPGQVDFGGEIRATGKIFIQSDALPLNREPKLLNGNLPPGQITFDDVDESRVTSGSATGFLNILRPSVAEPDVTLGLDVAPMTDLLATYRSRLSEVEKVDVSTADRGVLVEFLDSGEVLVSRGEWKTAGRCFDRSIYLTSKQRTDPAWNNDYLLEKNRDSYGSAAAELMTRREVAWDDPAYPNAPYPTVLKQDMDSTGDGVLDQALGDDLDGDGVNEEGDYFEVKRLTRDAEIQRFGLSRERWTVIYLTSSRADLPTADFPPKTTAPPVFVRGRVKGKCVLVYDAADDSIDPLGPHTHDPGNGTFTRFHIYVHADHEMPGDSSRVAQAGGVPGGLHLVDGRMKTLPDDTGTFSEDYVILLSRGSIRGSELGGFNLSWLEKDGSRRNYRKELADLDDAFAARYGSDDYRLHNKATYAHDWPTAPLEGIGIAHWSFHNRDRVLHDGRIVAHWDEGGTRYSAWGSFTWEKMFGTGNLPEGVNPERTPNLPDAMRAASAPISCEYRIRGALHSVGVFLATSGSADYDYRWRDMTAQQIEREIILPVGPLLLSRGFR